MDPLRPFLSLVRSLWTTGNVGKSAARTQGATASGSAHDASEILPSPSIEMRLHTHLAPIDAAGAWNAQRAREVFVNQVLLTELGEELAADPAFAQLAQRVSEHLGGDSRISSRLDELLREIAARA